jgi:hypothetical protein
MIKLFTLLLLSLPMVHTVVAPADPIANAIELIKNGNIRELAKTCAAEVDINVLGNEDTYPAAKAEAVVADFFNKHSPVKSVTVVHRVNSNPNFRFAVLSVTAGSGVYRTAISYKLVNGQFVLNELRIEADK